MSTDKKPTLFARATAIIAAGFLLAALLWLAHALDPFTYLNVHAQDPLKRDWARMFRVCGYLPLWLLVAAALWMTDRLPGRSFAWPSIRRAVWLIANPAMTGLVCEIAKIAVRRVRPEDADLEGIKESMYVFRAWEGEWWSTSGLGFPSSHVGVAAGAAAALTCLFPRAWPVWLSLPIGCALTRLLDSAHYLSDTIGAIIAAILTATILLPLFNRANKKHPTTAHPKP